MHTDDTSKKQVTMTSFCVRIKGKDVYNILAVTAHHIVINHTVEGIQHGI